MSLLKEAMTPCAILDKVTKSDGYGGYTTEWADGATIQCVIVLNNSIQAQIAQKQGTTAYYTITTEKNVNLRFHDVLRRNSDGLILRVTSNGDDNKTPESAGLNMRQVSAEEWNLTNG